jgi:hypothetical protein
MILAAGLLSAGLIATRSAPADAAMPTLVLDRSAVADTLVEEAGYYYRRRHYRPYRYGYRPYYRPYGYYSYGYRPYRYYGRRWRY